MSQKPSYILGINAYDHDVSACLLRDGEIAFAIRKERLTRQKHATGFYQEVVDYCLNAEGITLDDVDLVVRNCYVLPVDELESVSCHRTMPFYLPDTSGEQAKHHPLFNPQSDKIVTVSHHLAHAYSALCRLSVRRRRRDGGRRRRRLLCGRDGAVSATDRHGLRSPANPRATTASRAPDSKRSRRSGSIPARGFLSDEFYNMSGLGALYSRVSSYIFADWNKCGEVDGPGALWPPRADQAAARIQGRRPKVPEWGVEFNKPWLTETRDRKWEASPSMKHWEDLAWRIQEDTERSCWSAPDGCARQPAPKNLCIAGGVCSELRRQRQARARGRIRRMSGSQPAAGDDGIAIGCAYYGHLAIQRKPRSYVMNHAYLRQGLYATKKSRRP